MTDSGHTAVLTGAASRRGIGRATAERLAGEGWAVAVLDVDAGWITAATYDINGGLQIS
jgi:2-hydroxycyclohexanecarboxyl-CoA dehydrogenase